MKITELFKAGSAEFYLEKDGRTLASLTCSCSKDSLIIIETKGQLLPDMNLEDEGRLLVIYAVNYAMENHLKIQASCPLALSIFHKNPHILERANK